MYWRLDNYVIYYCLIAQTLKYVFIISCYLVNVNTQLIKYRNACVLAAAICMRRTRRRGAPAAPSRAAAGDSPVAKQPLKLSAQKGHFATDLGSGTPNFALFTGRDGKRL